jgi:hypothetical protein
MKSSNKNSMNAKYMRGNIILKYLNKIQSIKVQLLNNRNKRYFKANFSISKFINKMQKFLYGLNLNDNYLLHLCQQNITIKNN